jgi:hypothetical protein
VTSVYDRERNPPRVIAGAFAKRSGFANSGPKRLNHARAYFMAKPKRQRFCRGISVRLECGHAGVHPTSMYRLDARRLGCIIGDLRRRGVWCGECKTYCAVKKHLGTCRL